MKAIVCEICLKSAPSLLEVRTLESGKRSPKLHFCPHCLEVQLRRINHTKRKTPPVIDIPLDMDRPKITQEVKSMLD